MEQLNNIISEYIANLAKDYQTGESTGNATAELSFRPVLDSFFVEIMKFFGKDIQRIFEPRMQGKYGRPDWMFSNAKTMGIYGYVEAKGFNPNATLNPKDYESQVKRYLYLGNPVILTDGVDFILYRPSGTAKMVSVCSKPIKWDDVQPNTDALTMFRDFFKEEGYRTISEKQLVAELSARAKHLCADLESILSLEEDEAENKTERDTIVSLKNLWDIAKKNHDKSLEDNHTFAGFVAQILSFALLYAHRFVNEKDITPSEKYDRLHSFWTSAAFKRDALRLSPFKTLLDALSDELESKLSKLGIWYDNTRRLLSCVRLSDQQVVAPNYHELYEAFLKEYDGKTRNDFGAWYTPMCLAEYAVNFVNHVLPSVLPGESIEGKAVKIIDPCCGTGTFIEAVVNKLPLHEGSQIIGFEILPVPYALSNYRISMLEAAEKCDIEIVLTNTLSDTTFKSVRIEGGSTDAVSMFFRNEQKKALKLSKPPLTVIIGNPPCSDSADISNEGKLIAKLMGDFRPPVRKGRRNDQKQLVNEMTKFLRWCLFKADLSRPSVFSLVLPSTFANNVSFVTARKFLTEKVSEMWVLEFDVDNRAGHQAENLFNTLQGRLLLVGTLKEIETSLPTIHFKSISALSYKDKVDFFNAEVDDNGWENVKLDKNYIFKPTGNVDENLYSQFWHIASDNESAIFERHCSGLKLAPTHLLVHFNKGQLKRRNRFIADETNSYEQIKDRWYKGQTKPPAQRKLSHEVKTCLAKSDLKIVDYSYRPFLTAGLLLDNTLMDALRKTEGGGMRERPEVQAAYEDDSVFGFVAAPAPADIATKIKKFTSFSWYLPDNDLVTRGNSHIFCNKFPEYKKSQKNWKKEVKNNVNSRFLNAMSAAYGVSTNELSDEIVFYTYAVLNSDLYLHAFEGKLYATAGEWPAIPIPKDKSLFEQMVKIGKDMATIEKKDYQSEQALSIFSEDIINNEVEIYTPALSDEIISFTDAIGNVIRSTVVPKEILHFESSGYEVIREWMKYHSYAYYRKACGKEDFEDLFNLLGRIQDFKNQVVLADIQMKRILGGQFITPIR